jgi:hypothetical protein
VSAVHDEPPIERHPLEKFHALRLVTSGRSTDGVDKIRHTQRDQSGLATTQGGRDGDGRLVESNYAALAIEHDCSRGKPADQLIDQRSLRICERTDHQRRRTGARNFRDTTE